MTCFEDLMHHLRFCDAIDDFTPHAANQLENIVRSDGSFTTFAHDNNGNLIGENRYDNQGILAENRSYSYDFNARLVKVKVGQKSIFQEVLPPTFDPSIFRAQ